MLTWDIETAPEPDERLRELLPPLDESELQPSDFDPASVKTGNLKDEGKIQAKIRTAREKHEAEQTTLAGRLSVAKERHWQEFRDRAALDAVTGRVLVVGFYAPDRARMAFADGDGDERVLLNQFWHKYRDCRSNSRSMVGLNIHDFDLPFLVRRSWLLDVDVPPTVLEQHRYWDRIFVDLRRIWLCGQWGAGTKSNFDHLSRAFKTGGKPDGVTGADFARLWKEDRAKAEEYLAGDLKQPATWAERMGVV